MLATRGSLIPIVVALVALVTGCGNKSQRTITPAVCQPPKGGFQGNLRVSARATGKGYFRNVVIKVKQSAAGQPVRNAAVQIQGEMDCPMSMHIVPHDLHEVSPGVYKDGAYPFVMAGHWSVNIVVRSSKGVVTGKLPVTIGR
jgi:hypothetical protein